MVGDRSPLLQLQLQLLLLLLLQETTRKERLRTGVVAGVAAALADLVAVAAFACAKCLHFAVALGDAVDHT